MAEAFSKYSARSTLRVDLSAIRKNYETLKTKVGSATVAACVKADAYGLGIKPVARSLYGAGCRVFFVATAGEGKILREAIGDSSSIYVLNGPASRDLRLIFGADLKPVINSLEQARLWASAAEPVGSPPFSAIHIDTGMNRLGLSPEELTSLCRNKKMLNTLGADLVMSHLACAPDRNNPMNAKQLAQFRKASTQLPMKPLSLANSAGIFLGKPYHFQMVRPGIALYGGKTSATSEMGSIQSAVSLLAPVLQTRMVKAGETIGYDGLFTVERDMKVAVLAAGYADGIPISASGIGTKRAGYGTMYGKRVPIIGRVSMDLTIVDISKMEKPVNPGETVEFLGDHLERDAESVGTISYELLTRLGQRCRREYLTGA